MKTTISRGRNDNFDSRGCKFIKKDFSSGENEKKKFAVEWNSPPSSGFCLMVYGDNGV